MAEGQAMQATASVQEPSPSPKPHQAAVARRRFVPTQGHNSDFRLWRVLAICLPGLLLAACGFPGSPKLQVADDPARQSVAPALRALALDASDAPIHLDEDRVFASADLAGEEELEKMRGGFITAGGLKINFGIEAATYVNGDLQVSSLLTFDNLVSGQGLDTTLGNMVSDLAISHATGPGGIVTHVTNGGSNRDIVNVASITVDVLNYTNILGEVRSGSALGGRLPRLPVDVQNAFRDAIAR